MFLSVVTISPSSLRDTVPEPRFAGPKWDGSGFQPMKYSSWNVAGTLPSSFPYISKTETQTIKITMTYVNIFYAV